MSAPLLSEACTPQRFLLSRSAPPSLFDGHQRRSLRGMMRSRLSRRAAAWLCIVHHLLRHNLQQTARHPLPVRGLGSRASDPTNMQHHASWAPALLWCLSSLPSTPCTHHLLSPPGLSIRSVDTTEDRPASTEADASVELQPPCLGATRLLHEVRLERVFTSGCCLTESSVFFTPVTSSTLIIQHFIVSGLALLLAMVLSRIAVLN